jgi:hypothetical protein
MTVTGTTDVPIGLGCTYHTIVGCHLLHVIDPRIEAYPQVGSIQIQTRLDQPDAWLSMIADAGGLRRQEYHAWLAITRAPTIARPTIVDFTSYSFPELSRILTPTSSEVGDVDMTWDHPLPPDYLWFTEDEPPRLGPPLRRPGGNEAVAKDDHRAGNATRGTQTERQDNPRHPY